YADFQSDKHRHIVHVRIPNFPGEGKRRERRGRRGDGSGEQCLANNQ
ncbi:unnamed protein product, partial [Cylicostephanus goldi]